MADLPEFSWNGIHEAGIYINLATGDMFRIPGTALGPNGVGMLLTKHTMSADRLVQLTKNHSISLYEARVLCIKNNVKPNF